MKRAQTDMFPPDATQGDVLSDQSRKIGCLKHPFSLGLSRWIHGDSVQLHPTGPLIHTHDRDASRPTAPLSREEPSESHRTRALPAGTGGIQTDFIA